MYKRTALEEVMAKALQEIGIEFIEQYPTRSGFVLDFVISPNIAIEVDGPCHDGSRNRRRDRFRDRILETEGWKIYRLNHRIINDPSRLPVELNDILYHREYLSSH